jgi:superfamily II DNA or RNA helicase
MTVMNEADARLRHAADGWHTILRQPTAVEAVSATIDQITDGRLGRLPVSLLANLGVPRVQPLVDVNPNAPLSRFAGVDVDDLTRVSGIGPKSADAIMDAIEQITDDVYETTTVRVDVESRTRNDSRTLLAVWADQHRTDADRNLHDIAAMQTNLDGHRQAVATSQQALGEVVNAPAPEKRFWHSKARHAQDTAAHAKTLADAKTRHGVVATAAEAAAGNLLHDVHVPVAPTLTSSDDLYGWFTVNGASVTTAIARAVQQATAARIFRPDGSRWQPALSDVQFDARWLNPDGPQFTLLTIDEDALADSPFAYTVDSPAGRRQARRQQQARDEEFTLDGVLPPSEVIASVHAVTLDESLLRIDLRSYQQFAARYALHARKVIIGDEMGLGKTAEAIAVAAHLTAADTHARILVVAPTSVLINWQREIDKFTGLPSTLIHGTAARQRAAAWRRDGGIAITSYGSTGHVFDNDDVVPACALVVFDEAHLIKNPKALRTDRADRLIDAADHAVLMSGTPMTSSLEDFAVLAGHIDPDYGAYLRTAIERRNPQMFRQYASACYLRRNQSDVLDELPDLIELDDIVMPNDGDLAAYKQALADNTHPMVIRSMVGSRVDGSKMDRLAEIWDEARADGQSMMVFTYFRGTVDAACERLGGDVVGVITGDVSPASRQDVIDRLEASATPGVIVAQIEAGGVGLNIQCASVGVIVEPQWNPAPEEQAIKRMHRMGQTRTVIVHRLLSGEPIVIDEFIAGVRDGKAEVFARFIKQSDLAVAAGDSSTNTVNNALAALLARERRVHTAA